MKRRSFLSALGLAPAAVVLDLGNVFKKHTPEQNKERQEILKSLKYRHEFVVAFMRTKVLPGQSMKTVIVPEFPRGTSLFVPHKIVIPSKAAESFNINDFSVGNMSQFNSNKNGPVPAVVFSESSFGVALNIDFVRPGMDISINIVNIDKKIVEFSGVIVGKLYE